MTRRECLKLAAAGTLAAGSATAAKMDVRYGCMQGSLPQGTPAEAFAAAKRVGLGGVELNLGRDVPDGKLPLADPERQRAYMDAAAANGLVIAGVVLDVFHRHYLKNDPAAIPYIDAGIELARLMKARVLLLPFFGKGALTNREEMARVADIVKEHAGTAQKAGILLGFEDTISAEDNAFILDRVASPVAKVYYDVGNSTNIGGFDAPKEIRWLGGDRICQMHIKDRGYIGEGKVDIAACVRAIRDARYKGFLNFETSAPSGDREADLKRNFEYLKKAVAAAEAA